MYSADNAFIINSFHAITFAVPHRVTDAFDELLVSLDDEMDDVLTSFLSYFDYTWTGVVQRGRRHPPVFAITTVSSMNFLEQTIQLNDGIIRLLFEWPSRTLRSVA